MPTNLISLTMGHVESAYVSRLILINRGEPFERGIDALQNLAQGLVTKYWDGELRFHQSNKPCCMAYLKRTKSGQFCPTCGGGIRPAFDIHDFQNWLWTLNGATSDGWGEEFSDSCSWWAWPDMLWILRCPPEEVLSIDDQAESYIILALQGDELDANGFADAVKGWQSSTTLGSREEFIEELDDPTGDFRLSDEDEEEEEEDSNGPLPGL